MPSSLDRQIDRAQRALGGSTLTRVARAAHVQHIFSRLHALNIRVADLSDLKSRHVARYVADQRAALVGSRTLQNRLSSLRQCLRSVGRAQLAGNSALSTRALGLAGAPRIGTHRAVSDRQLLDAQARAAPGVAAAMGLQRWLGLRAREAIQSPGSLARWERELASGGRVTVVHGTKGGRARTSAPADRQEALQAVRAALEVVRAQGGRLIASTSLQGAARAYCRGLADAGLRGEHASHALRYAYARDLFGQYRTLGVEPREARSMLAVDLGHGDGRGRYVAQVYLR